MENSRFTSSSAAEAGPKLPESDDDKKDTKKTKSGLGSLVGRSSPKAEKGDSDESWSSFKLFERPESADSSADKDVKPAVETAEKTAPQPEMTADDLHYAAAQIAAERQTEIAAEPADTDAESQAATAAAHEYYQKIVSDEQLPAEAAAAMLEELDVLDNTSSPESIPSSEHSDNETHDEPSDGEFPISENENENEDSQPNASNSRTGGNTGGCAGDGMPPPPPPPPSRPSAAAAGAGAPGHGSNQQPLPPQPPINPAFAPSSTSLVEQVPSATRTEYIPYYDRSRAASDMLVGGIVGYLIGRRRGRIKTERKLLPIQKKLEREVSSLRQDIISKEFTIREAARSKVREQRQMAHTEATVSLHTTNKTSPETVILNTRNTRERPLRPQPTSLQPEMRRLVSLPAPESIGKVLVAAEAVDARTDLITKRETTNTNKNSVERQVETLSRNELLTLSEKVIVEGSTLRQVYETHLISERGLRRLVSEYLRGGDVVRAFRREIIEREIDFERDPKLRDTVRKGLKSSGGASPTLQKLLAQAGVSTEDESAHDLARSRADQLHAAKKQTKRQSQRKLVDVSLVSIIAVLLSVIIMLAINRI